MRITTLTFRLSLMLGFLSATGLSQDLTTLKTSARDSARPVSALLNQLRKRERVAITYEDPRYSMRSDMDERPTEFSYAPEGIRTQDGTDLVVARMLREYGASKGLTFTMPTWSRRRCPSIIKLPGSHWNVLLDSLAAPGAFVWDLYYDPADGKYGLNFSYVGPATMPKTARSQ